MPSLQLLPGTPASSSPSSASSRIPYLATPRQQQQPVSSKSGSPGSSSKLALNGQAAQRRLSEEPDFEDLIMRGDTLRMTLTPLRFRQSSKDGSTSSNAAPRRVHGSGTSLGHTKKHSHPARARGYSIDKVRDSASSCSTSLPLAAGIKLKARSAVAPKQPFGEDETESSNTEKEMDIDRDDDEEELDLDPEDEAILGPSDRKKRHFLLEKKRLASKKNKETLFDILNSKPPWENDTSVNNSNVQSDSKADRMLGNRNGLTNASSSSRTSDAVQPAPSIAPKKFAPIANLDIIYSLEAASPSKQTNMDSRSLDARISQARAHGGLLTTPSIPDTTSLFTTTSLDGQSDFFSSKASFALTRKESPLPPHYQQLDNAPSSGVKANLATNEISPNRLSSYKSSPALGTMSAHSIASMMGTAGSSSVSIPTPTTLRPTPVRKLEAKDERIVGRRVNDDLMDFLRSATPPGPPAPTTFSKLDATLHSTLLPTGNNRTTTILSNNTNGKTRLGSVSFRSLMGRGSKRPSTAPGPTTTSDFSKVSTMSGLGSCSNGLSSVDEMGRFRSVNEDTPTRTAHSSLLHIGRRQSESRDAPVSSLPIQRSRESRVSGSVPPTAHLAHTAHRQNLQPVNTPRAVTTTSTSTMIMTGGHAASQIAKQAQKEWELAQIVEKELGRERLQIERERLERVEQEELNKKGLMLIKDSYATFTDAQSQLTPKAFDRSMKEQRDTVPHHTPATHTLHQAPLLTPEHSRDDLCHISSNQQECHENVKVSSTSVSLQAMTQQAEATSGVDTPPMTPEEKGHSPQFTFLQWLPEDRESRIPPSSTLSRPSISTSVVSASPSTVMPGMAHKHQRRLSAVRRKPSPKVESTNVAAPPAQMKQIVFGDASNHTVLYKYATQRSREASNSSQSSGLEPPFATSPAAMLVDEYRGSTTSGRIIEEDVEANVLLKKIPQASQASIRSLPSTINSTLSTTPLSDLTTGLPPHRVSTLSRSGSTNGTSRPPSTVILPLSPRYVLAGNINNKAYQADIHDVLLSLRNNMISANSVSECLEIVDAALFEIAYDTKDSYAPSVIEEEMMEEAPPSAVLEEQRKVDIVETMPEEDVKKPDIGLAKESAAERAAMETVREIVKLRPRTSRYVNRVFDAIIDYHLSYPSPPSIFPRNYHRLSAIKTYAEPIEPKEVSLALSDRAQLAKDNKAPSLDYSVGESTNIGSEDGVLDKTASDTTLVGDIETVKALVDAKDTVQTRDVTFTASEEDEEEVLQKALEAAA